MFKLESNRLKREFKIVNGNFFASQILNKYSGMSFIPDGNGCEFVVRFVDGGDFSAKGLPVIDSSEEAGRLKFVFQEVEGVSVTLEYWVHKDGNTLCKQLTLTQSNSREIDFIYLDSVGIINSQTHLGANRIEGSLVPEAWAALGQPFYIDSLFFGCEFPATDNRIVHGTGRVKYYIGKSVGRNYKCPVTVMGAAKDNTVNEVKHAFFEYLETVRTKSALRFQFNSWFDNFDKISSSSVCRLFSEINDSIQAYALPQLDAYTVDDGWWNSKADFWNFNKAFPNGLDEVKETCEKIGSGLGLWLSPRGGYKKLRKKLGTRLEKAGNGFYDKANNEICTASAKYVEKLGDYLIELTEKYRLTYLKLDGFAIAACRNETHDHACGGAEDMYFITDMWEKWIAQLQRLRDSSEAGRQVIINLTSYANLSPWWLQWVNAIWLQNSEDIGFSENIEEQSRLESMLTYRDARYYDALCRRTAQLPLDAIYNHEPIYGNKAKANYGVDFSDEEFEKYLYWNAVRGAALNELHLSPEMMNEEKWQALKKAMLFQTEAYDVLKNGMFIGGDPEENNVYGFISWNGSNGIIALRNPTDEKTPLTLTFNKLMGAPETLNNVKRSNVYCKSLPEDEVLYSYNDKLELTLHPFEIMIFKLNEQRN